MVASSFSLLAPENSPTCWKNIELPLDVALHPYFVYQIWPQNGSGEDRKYTYLKFTSMDNTQFFFYFFKFFFMANELLL